MSAILEVKNLVKDYGPYRAVDDISFNVEKGTVVGFLGPNGAGKTTTIQILCSITLATSGSISYFGKDFYQNREECLGRINFASAFNTLQGRISVLENLLVFADLYGVKNAKKKSLDLLEYFEIEQLKNVIYQNLSAGQKTRVNLVKSLLNDPELLLLDEPTASLDPDIADKTLTLIEDMRKNQQISILYTSHDMDEITRVCDEVIFLDHGKIIAHDTPLGLTKRISKASIRVTFDGKKEDVEKFVKEKEYSYIFHGRNVVEITTEEKLIPKVIFGLSNNDIWLTDIEVNKPTLEDFFLQIARGGSNVI